jgi:hypothetical protein
LKAGRSFSIETTLSGHSHLATIGEARGLGYRIELNYVGTGDVTINLERIRRRVAAGGHDVPEADVRRRYERSLMHAPSVVATADYIMIFDNSGEEMLASIGKLVRLINIATSRRGRSRSPTLYVKEVNVSRKADLLRKRTNESGVQPMRSAVRRSIIGTLLKTALPH